MTSPLTISAQAEFTTPLEDDTMIEFPCHSPETAPEGALPVFEASSKTFGMVPSRDEAGHRFRGAGLAATGLTLSQPILDR